MAEQDHDQHSQQGQAGEDEGVSFIRFVFSLAHNAAVYFGDAPDPNTGQPMQPNLEGARHMIEILEMLEGKTRGNLSAEERHFLEQIIYELRLRFVEATRGGGPQADPPRIIIP